MKRSLHSRTALFLLAAIVLATSVSARDSERAKELARIKREVRTARKGSRTWLRELRKTDPEQAKFYELGDLAERQVNAGELDQAEASAKELLAVADHFQCDWNYGNAIHKAQIVLGRVALARGDRETAKARLLDAGRTPGSPQLASAGPDMRLAKALLLAGERTAVLRYFELCAKFWKLGSCDLEEWRAAVEAGNVPEFRRTMRAKCGTD